MLITPRLVRALNPDEVPPLPTLPGRFLPPGDDLGGRLEGGGGTVDGPPVDEPRSAADRARRRGQEIICASPEYVDRNAARC